MCIQKCSKSEEVVSFHSHEALPILIQKFIHKANDYTPLADMVFRALHPILTTDLIFHCLFSFSFHFFLFIFIKLSPTFLLNTIILALGVFVVGFSLIKIFTPLQRRTWAAQYNGLWFNEETIVCWIRWPACTFTKRWLSRQKFSCVNISTRRTPNQLNCETTKIWLNDKKIIILNESAWWWWMNRAVKGIG